MRDQRPCLAIHRLEGGDTCVGARRDSRRRPAGSLGRVVAVASALLLGACATEGQRAGFDYDAVSADPAAFYGRVQGVPGGGASDPVATAGGAGLREEDALDRMRERTRPGRINREMGDAARVRGINAAVDQAASADRSGEVRRQTLVRRETELQALRVQGHDRTTPSGTVGDRRLRTAVEVDRLRRQDVLDSQREEALTATQRRGAAPASTAASDASEALRRDMRRAFERQRVTRPGRIGGTLPDIGSYEPNRP